MIQGQESYDHLKSSGSNLFGSVGGLIKNKRISVDGDGDDIVVELFLGGDYKVKK